MPHTFQLYSVHAPFFNKSKRRGHGLLTAHLVAPEWHVPDDKGPASPSAYRLAMGYDRVDGYGLCGVLAMDHHRCTIADKQHVHACTIYLEQAKSQIPCSGLRSSKCGDGGCLCAFRKVHIVDAKVWCGTCMSTVCCHLASNNTVDM